MKAFLLALAVLAIPSAGVVQTAPLSCDGVAPPPPLTDTVTDPAAVKYAGPICAEGEECQPVEDSQPGVEVLPEGVRYTFTYVGELRAVEVDGIWHSEELAMLPTGKLPTCWAWQWRRVD